MNAKLTQQFAFVLIVLISVSMTPQMILSQDTICKSVQEMSVLHGNDVIWYLNSRGQDCLEPTPTPTPVSRDGELLARSGIGDHRESVDLSFSQGIYRLSLISPQHDRDSGIYISLDDVITVPDRCLRRGRYSWWGVGIPFPVQILVEQDCQVYATFVVNVQLGSKQKHWEVNIARFNPPPDATSADDWTLSSKGSQYSFLDLTFAPGIYRINVDNPTVGNGKRINLQTIISNPPYCFSSSEFEELPFQTRIESMCRMYAVINANLYSEHEHEVWKVSITKVD